MAEAGTVIAGASLTVDVLSKVLGGSKIAASPSALITSQAGLGPRKAFSYLDFMTTSNVVIPEKVHSGKALIYSAKKVCGVPMAEITVH